MEDAVPPFLDSDEEDQAPPLVDSDDEGNVNRTPPRKSQPDTTEAKHGSEQSSNWEKEENSSSPTFGANMGSFFSLAFAARRAFSKNDPTQSEQPDSKNTETQNPFHNSKYSPKQETYNIANRDEAMRAYHEGARYFESGDYEKALNFLKRSNRLYPTEEATRLLDRTNHKIAEIRYEEEQRQERERQRREEEERLRESERKRFVEEEARRKEEERAKQKTSWWNFFSKKEAATVETKTTADGTTTYTKEHEEEILRVSQCHDHYEVLGIERTASSSDVKKAYFRLARKLHPDKNTAPGSEAAFHDLQAAYDSLYDEQTRQQYDTKLASMARRGEVGDGRQKERTEKQKGPPRTQWKDMLKLWRLIYRVPLLIGLLCLKYGFILLRFIYMMWKGSTWTEVYYFPFTLSWVILEVTFFIIIALVLLTVRLPWTWRHHGRTLYHLLWVFFYYLKALAADHSPRGEGDESEGGDDFHYSETSDQGERLEVWEEGGRFYATDPEGVVYDVTDMCRNWMKDQKRGKQKDFSYYQMRWPPTPVRQPGQGGRQSRHRNKESEYNRQQQQQQQDQHFTSDRHNPSTPVGKKKRGGKKGRRGKRL